MKLHKGIMAAMTLVAGFALTLSALTLSAQAFTINVVDQEGEPVAGFKFLVEEDNTHRPQPGVHLPINPADVNDNTLAASIHKSHARTLLQGDTTGSSVTIGEVGSEYLLPDGRWDPTCIAGPGQTCVTLPEGRYFVSVLPFGNNSRKCIRTGNPNNRSRQYDMGGAPIDTSTQDEVTIYVRQTPLETARISVKVFHDILPLNNAPDAREIALDEGGDPVYPMAGFTVTLGDQGGDIVADVYGNPVGTEYKKGVGMLDEQTCAPQITKMGTGDFITPANGEIIIENLAPGKYAVQVEPPAGDEGWLQVTTIEGTKTIDAWVRPDEPPFLVEFGPPAWHTFYGFVKEMDLLSTFPPGPKTTVRGTIHKAHSTRPPIVSNTLGPVPEAEGVGERCIVGLNSLQAGFPEALWVGKCEDGTGNFEIPNVPPGEYQITVFDVQLLQIIAFNTVITGATGGILDLGDIAVPMWFGVQEHNVYADVNKNNIRDPGEQGIPEQNINLRFRDGTIYQAFPTDFSGFVPFQAVFPFFHWQVAEVDFARLQATGVRAVVDEGGVVDHGPLGEGKRRPQNQGGGPLDLEVVEDGPALTMGYQQFADQNTRFEWGKAPYDLDFNAVVTTSELDYFLSIEGWPDGAGDVDDCTEGAPGCTVDGDGAYDNNGGISGTVTFAVTRAEDDPRLAAVEGWEPGIPRVQVNLYRDVWCASNGLPAVYPLCPQSIPGEIGDGIPDNPDGIAGVDLADIDNYPFGWDPERCGGPGQDPCTGPGPEDINRTGDPLVFDLGDAIRVTITDSWDDAQPEGCVNPTTPLSPTNIHGTDVPIENCVEGLRTWNQVKPAVFDGGWAFGPGDPLLVPGTYLVEAVAPPGYKHIAEEDRNVDFGPTPVPVILPPRCVGDDHMVPPLFSFLTDDEGNPLPGIDPSDPDNEAPFAGQTRKRCDVKRVDLGAGQNAAAEFHLFTDVPKAARGVGLITGDLTNQLNPNRPDFGEKFSPAWIPIAVFDYTGREVFRTHGDEFGNYNFLAASTYAINLPTPSGVGPKMHKFCLNHPTLPDGSPEPFYQPGLTTTCYQFNFETGRVIYLDTPVIRQSAFTAPTNQTLDCEPDSDTPMIREVMNTTTDEPAVIRDGQRLVITSVGGPVQVPNPDYPGDINPPDGFPDDPPLVPQFVDRFYGFGGTAGTVCIDPNPTVDGDEVCPAHTSWGDDEIVFDPFPGGVPSGQLTVTRSNGNKTVAGLTLTVNPTSSILRVGVGQTFDPASSPTPIQDALDAASDGDLILVDPGQYAELPIVTKRVKLQGAGAGHRDVSAGGTVLNASHFGFNPAFPEFSPVQAWRDKLDVLDDEVGLLQEQTGPCKGDDKFFCLPDGQAPGIFVAPNPDLHDFDFVADPPRYNLAMRARIDGFQIRLADTGGAIYVNANADKLQISNNRLVSNAGNFGGAIRVGNPAAVVGPLNVPIPDGSNNPQIDIHHNQISQNGAVRTGGGIGIYKGATSYRVGENSMCGNFARSGGGGLAHQGLSDNGVIAQNEFLFNEAFQGIQPGGFGVGGAGGGIQVAGDPDLVVPGGLTEGSGDVTIDKNLFQGNLGGAGDGGAIALSNTNGDDVADNPDNDPEGNPWWIVSVTNNMMVNNAAGLAGGGMSMLDATDVRIVHNTIANNDATATAAAAFEAGRTNPSTPQPGGIVSRGHSAGLLAAIGNGTTFSEPQAGQFRKNILYHNRSFFLDPLFPPLQLNAAGDYWDLGVVGTGSPDCLNPDQSWLTDLMPAADPAACDYTLGNMAGDPLFVDGGTAQFNVYQVGIAADEGGNFAQVVFTPLARHGDYHLQAGSPAVDGAPADTSGLLAEDIDLDMRDGAPDIGADEVP